MNKIFRAVCLSLCALFAAGTLAACNRQLQGEPINTDATQLTIGVFDGGLGSDWVYAIKDDFEAKYANVSFEEGKTGVQLRVSPSRSFTQTGMEQNIESFNEEVIFAEGANAQYFASRGNFLDITDVVKDHPLSYDFVTGETDPNGENVTIESKISQTQRDYFSAVDGKYYALPTSETYYCIVYDIELFEDNNLFFAPDGSFVTSASDERSGGPDGDTSTAYDNGLPATYAQFFQLCQKIVDLNKNYIPVMWGGNVQEYVSSFLLALAADYAGVEQTELNYNYNGVMREHITSFDNGTPVISETEVPVSASNGYELYKQPGRYYALTFLQQLTSKNEYYNYKTATSSAFTHQDAQGQFVMGKYRDSMQRVAMLIDGNWWQSEAKGVFNDLVAEEGQEASMQNRKFGIMPLPKYDASALGEYTLLQNTGYIGFINPRVADYKTNLAKAFLQYCYTDEALVAYTQSTSICRPVSYEMGDAYDGLSTWGKSMVDLHQNANFAYQDSASKIMQNYSVDLWYSPRLWMSVANGKTYTYPSTAMINDSVTAQAYFEGMSAYWTESVWKNHFQNV